MYIKSLLALAILSSVPMPAIAATFCISDSASLAQALTAAQASPEADTVMLVEGTLVLPGGGLNYQAPVGETRDLALEGGFDPGCTSRRRGRKTTLDANAVTANVGIRIVAGPSLINVSNLVVINMPLKPNDTNNLAMDISVTEGSVNLEANAFLVNSGRGGVLRVTGLNGPTRLVDNIFADNIVGTDAVRIQSGALSQDRYCEVANNTITRNHSSSTAGLLLDCNTGMLVSNVLWGNDGFDLQLYANAIQGGSYELRANDIELAFIAVNVGVTEKGRINLDPKFLAGTFAFDPQQGSPIIDAGDAAALLSENPSDYYERPRIENGRIDIGAIERSFRIFASGFE